MGFYGLEQAGSQHRLTEEGSGGAAGTLIQAVGTALFSAFFVGYPVFFVETAFLVIDTSDQIKIFANNIFT